MQTNDAHDEGQQGAGVMSCCDAEGRVSAGQEAATNNRLKSETYQRLNLGVNLQAVLTAGAALAAPNVSFMPWAQG